MDLENSGITVHEIDDHDEIPQLLADLALRTRPPHLFVAGSSNLDSSTPEQDEEILGPWCAAVANTLVETRNWTINSLGGAAGWYTSRDIARARRKENTYNASQLMIHYRRKDEPPEDRPERVGTAIYSDLGREDLVPSVLDSCRALIAINGGRRTSEEISWAADRRVAVIPLAAAGGAALKYWEDYAADPPDIGSRPTDRTTWALLNDSDPLTAARAAKRLLDQAMYETASAS